MRWRYRTRAIALALVWLAMLQSALRAASATQPVRIDSIVSIGTTVQDMDRSLDFYTRVLDFRKLSDEEFAGEQLERYLGVFGARCRVVKLQLGTEMLELTQFLTPRGRPVPPDSRSNDRWFQHIAIVVRDMDEAYQRLRASHVRHVSSGPQRLPEWNANAAGIEAFYFLDPDEHVLEIIHFPPGKGQDRWQNISHSVLFAGIDHTAIVVSDTERSLKFYRDQLGLKVAGTSENYGTEQEHLNNVFGARLRITALRAASGPGLEFLEYLTPRDGRPMPADAKPNDLFHWHITMSSSAMTEPALVRDVDGHCVSLPKEVTRP